MICKHCGEEFYEDDRPGQHKPGLFNECFRCGTDHIVRVLGESVAHGPKGTSISTTILPPGVQPARRRGKFVQ
jgi:NAD-dependent SIR2 family protein deacetylase